MSNQVNISLDRRRVDQIARLAGLEGKKVAQWIEDRVSEAWPVAFPDEPIPGVRVWASDSERAVHVSLHDNLRDDQGRHDFPPLTVSSEVAEKIAFGLRGVAEREVSNFKLAIAQDRQMQIRRQGTGVNVIITTEGREKPDTWSSTPRMAVEIADCIARVARAVP